MKSAAKHANIYRMATDQHLCPFGLRSLELLKRHGYQVDDHVLGDREQVEQFKQRQQVKTTPQIYINGERVGGYEGLRQHLSLPVKDDTKTTYAPVIAIFTAAFFMALIITWSVNAYFVLDKLIMWFMALSICILSIQKLQNIDAFINQFITYDLLAQKWLRYALIYPFVEFFVGVGVIGLVLNEHEVVFKDFFLIVTALLAGLIGMIGVISVVKAVYLDKRQLKCACVGGNANVPLGFISLSENIIMVVMAVVLLTMTL